MASDIQLHTIKYLYTTMEEIIFRHLRNKLTRRIFFEYFKICSHLREICLKGDDPTLTPFLVHSLHKSVMANSHIFQG